MKTFLGKQHSPHRHLDEKKNTAYLYFKVIKVKMLFISQALCSLLFQMQNISFQSSSMCRKQNISRQFLCLKVTQQSQLLPVLFALSPLVFTFFAGEDPGIFYPGGLHFDSERTSEPFFVANYFSPTPPTNLVLRSQKGTQNNYYYIFHQYPWNLVQCQNATCASLKKSAGLGLGLESDIQSYRCKNFSLKQAPVMTGGIQTPWMRHCFAPFFFSFLGHLLGFISLEKQLQSNLYMTTLHTMVTRQFPEKKYFCLFYFQ